MSSSDVKVAVVIIHFNSEEYLHKCLMHVCAQTHQHIDVVVVDNASKVNLADEVRKLEETYSYIRLEENIGSTRANNLGISSVSADFYLVLNADVFLGKEYVSACLDIMKSNDRVGAVAGKLRSFDNPDLIDTVGIYLTKEATANEIGQGLSATDNFLEDMEVFGVCCAAALYRSEMIYKMSDEGKLFDEQIFAFCEETELSVRMLSYGFISYFCAKADALHVRGGSSADMSPFVKAENIRNSQYIYQKYFRSSKFILSGIFYNYRLIAYWSLLKDVTVATEPLDKHTLLKVRTYMRKSYLLEKCLSLFSH